MGKNNVISMASYRARIATNKLLECLGVAHIPKKLQVPAETEKLWWQNSNGSVEFNIFNCEFKYSKHTQFTELPPEQ